MMRAIDGGRGGLIRTRSSSRDDSPAGRDHPLNDHFGDGFMERPGSPLKRQKGGPVSHQVFIQPKPQSLGMIAASNRAPPPEMLDSTQFSMPHKGQFPIMMSPIAAFQSTPVVTSRQSPSIGGSVARENATGPGGEDLRRNCDYCVRKKVKCNGMLPCHMCRRKQFACVYSVKQKPGPKVRTGNESQGNSVESTVSRTAARSNHSNSPTPKTGHGHTVAHNSSAHVMPRPIHRSTYSNGSVSLDDEGALSSDGSMNEYSMQYRQSQRMPPAHMNMIASIDGAGVPVSGGDMHNNNVQVHAHSGNNHMHAGNDRVHMHTEGRSSAASVHARGPPMYTNGYSTSHNDHMVAPQSGLTSFGRYAAAVAAAHAASSHNQYTSQGSHSPHQYRDTLPPPPLGGGDIPNEVTEALLALKHSI